MCHSGDFLWCVDAHHRTESIEAAKLNYLVSYESFSFINLGYSTLLPDVDVTRVPKKHLKSAAPAVRHNGHQVTHGSLTSKFNVKM